jgi:DNA-binding MarR family transcriptional regulator
MTKNNPDGAIDYGILPDLLGYKVRLTQIEIFRDFVESLTEFDLTPTKFGTLLIIEANPGIKQKDLASALQIDRSTAVPLIDGLEKQGYVARIRLDNDRRTNALHLTKQGVGFLKKTKPLVLAHENRLLARLTNNEQAQLFKLLDKVASG